MKILRRALALLIALSLATPALAKPALWKIQDADTTIYLFGTIHALPPGHKWRSRKLNKAIRASDSLVVETLVGDDPNRLFALLTSMALDPSLPALDQRVAEPKRAVLMDRVVRSGIAPAAFDRMESWAATLMLTGVMARDLGIGGADGVEHVLQESFGAAQKPVSGLETLEEQLSFFDRLPTDSQNMLLGSMGEGIDAERSEFEAMIAAWSRGDQAAIAKSFTATEMITPALRDGLLIQRNRNWTEKLKARLGQPGTTFVAVGAGHLAGENSVQDMLAADGIKAIRVQ